MIESETLVEQGGNESSASIGEILRKGREEKGLSQEDVANQLCLRPQSVEALENDLIEEGVSATYVKGYVKLYARLLAIKPEPLLTAFDRFHRPETKQSSLQSFSRRVAREANDSRWNIVTYVIASLVLGSVVLWWIEQSDFSDRQTVSAGVEQAVVSDELQAGSAGASSDYSAIPAENGQTRVLTATMENSNAGQGVSPTTLTLDNDASQSLNTTANPITSQPSAETAIQVADEEASQINVNTLSESSETINQIDEEPVEMVFFFSDDCWVDIKDGLGDTIAIGTKVKGRVMPVSGVPPIRVVLGAPQAVELNVNGEPVDLSAYPAKRTASFEIL